MRYCRNCNRILADDEPFCKNCCPPDSDPEDNWAFAPLGNIVYIDDDAPLPEELKAAVAEAKGARTGGVKTGESKSGDSRDGRPLTETQQLNMAFDFNDLTLMTEPVKKKREVNYLDEVPKAPKTTGAQRKRTLSDLLGPDAALLEQSGTERAAAQRAEVKPPSSRADARTPEPAKAAAGGQGERTTPSGGVSMRAAAETRTAERGGSPHENLSPPAQSVPAAAPGGQEADSAVQKRVNGDAGTPRDNEPPQALKTRRGPDDGASSGEPKSADAAEERRAAAPQKAAASVSFSPSELVSQAYGPAESAGESGKAADSHPPVISFSTEDLKSTVDSDAGAERRGDEQTPQSASPRQKRTFRASAGTYVDKPAGSAEAPTPVGEKYSDPRFAVFAPAAPVGDKKAPQTTGAADRAVKAPLARPAGDRTGAQPNGAGTAPLGQGKKDSTGAQPNGARQNYHESELKELSPRDGAKPDSRGRAGVDAVPREEAGALDKQIKDPAFQTADLPVEKPYGKLGVTVVALLLAGLFIVTGFSIFRLAEAPSQEQLILQQLEGVWVSDEFSLRSDPEHPLREVLTVGEGSFSSVCYAPDDTKDGYLTGEWPTVSSVEGALGAYVEQSVILSFSYTGGGNSDYYFIREILSLSEDELILREYYDEERTDYYDLTFTRGVG